MCYNEYSQEGKPRSSLSKKLKKDLDKRRAMCYNKGVKRETPQTYKNWVATERRKERKNIMTNREFYQSVIALSDASAEVNVAEISAKAQELLEKLDASNAKRTSADSKQKKEVSARREVIFAALTSEPMTADAIAEKCGVTIGQARSALTAFVKDERAIKAEVKIGKTRKMVYSLPSEE